MASRATRVLAWGFRFNTLHKPCDNPKIRQAVAYALNGKDFLDASIGDPKWYRECKSLFPWGSPLESTAGWDDKLSGNAAKAQQLLENAGFKADLQAMDSPTLVSRRAKKDPPSAGAWHAFVTTWSSAEVLDPVSTSYLNASCDKATFGWPCDAEIERLRDAFAKETDPEKQRAIAQAVQRRAAEAPTHVHLGQYVAPVAYRKSLSGVLVAPNINFWNIEKR